jgi:DNA-binding CsgD family transcriptional regulator/PAS domain-containing protein
MNDASDILHLAERFYAAAAAPEQWGEALASVADRLGGGHAILDMYGTGPAGGSIVAMAGIDERDVARARSPDAARLAAPLFGAMPLETFDRTALISDADFERSALYNEILRPLDGFRSLHFRHNGTSSAFLVSVCRSHRAEDFDPTDKATMQTLAPHFRTALALQSRLQTAELRSSGLAQVLDRLDGGVIVTDASARPLHVNARAARIGAEADGLSVDNGALTAGSAQATKQLRDAIAAVSSDAAIEGQRIRIERPSHRPALLLTVLPIWRLGAVIPGASVPRTVIFITEPDAPLPIDRLAIAEAFRLTRRESEIAALLADGLDLETIAARLGTGRGTVRDHLKHLFQKTGARSQVALVALLRGFVDRTQ